MKFNEIISISGKSGLFRLLNSRGDGIIVQSLEDNKSTFVSTRIHNVITLDNIAIFREHEETSPLRDVLIAMKDNETENRIPEPRSDENALRAYLEKILPDYDKQRVHVSDMKKLVKWYHILKQRDILPQTEDEIKGNEDQLKDEENRIAEEIAGDEEKPKRKTTAKKESEE